MTPIPRGACGSGPQIVRRRCPLVALTCKEQP
jgi:hypothetical protein